jgi:hypothetical protein
MYKLAQLVYESRKSLKIIEISILACANYMLTFFFQSSIYYYPLDIKFKVATLLSEKLGDTSLSYTR